jgi:hypothetical protein
MEAFLLEYTRLAEAGVTVESLLEGAAAGMRMSAPYCKHLVSVLLDAVAEEAELPVSELPQLNYFTVFAETWHAASLARLSDADIANAWHLADYLMLDAACVVCLEDVVVQRQARSGVANRLIAVPSNNVNKRVAEVMEALSLSCANQCVARGIVVPGYKNIDTAASWGHWDLLLQARAAGVEWDTYLTHCAACAGHLRMLQQLLEAGCPWSPFVVPSAVDNGNSSLAILALEHGAPTFDDWLSYTARCGCLPVLQWAWSHGRLPAETIPELRWHALNQRHGHVVVWLDEVAVQEPAIAAAATGAVG